MRLKQDNSMADDFKILEEKENPLFNRKEIKASIEATVTPSHADVKKLICEKFSSQIEKIKIKKISGKFGSRTSIITANIYDSKENLEKTEPKSQRGIDEVKKEEKKVGEEIIKKETDNKSAEETTEEKSPEKEIKKAESEKTN